MLLFNAIFPTTPGHLEIRYVICRVFYFAEKSIFEIVNFIRCIHNKAIMPKAATMGRISMRDTDRVTTQHSHPYRDEPQCYQSSENYHTTLIGVKKFQNYICEISRLQP